MDRYKVTLKRDAVSKFETFSDVVGHHVDKEQNRLTLVFCDGSIHEFPGFNDFEVKLGPDWALARAKHLAAQSGQQPNFNFESKSE